MLTWREIGIPLLRTMVGNLLTIISTVIARPLPIIRTSRNNAAQSSPSQLPTIADHRQDSEDRRQAGSIGSRSAIDCFNDRQREAGIALVAEPIGHPAIAVDGPTAAATFVRWAAEHGFAREWKVDEVWYIASEDFVPAHDLILPPRRVFLGALKKTPGVTCTPNRRVYDHDGNLLGKTTFYRLPTTPEARAAAESPALRAMKHAA